MNKVTDGHKARWNPRLTSYPLPDLWCTRPRTHRELSLPGFRGDELGR